MPKVLNKRVVGIPKGAVYIGRGRGSKWGNPFVIDKDGTRGEVIAKFERYLCDSPLLAHIGELRGKDLVCWCAPEPCHGDVLLRYANKHHTRRSTDDDLDDGDAIGDGQGGNGLKARPPQRNSGF